MVGCTVLTDVNATATMSNLVSLEYHYQLSSIHVLCHAGLVGCHNIPVLVQQSKSLFGLLPTLFPKATSSVVTYFYIVLIAVQLEA